MKNKVEYAIESMLAKMNLAKPSFTREDMLRIRSQVRAGAGSRLPPCNE